jgi:hypothetical protein
MNILKAEKNDKGVIVHETDKGEKIHYIAVRAGLSWPVKGAPGYYCIIGEEFKERNKFTKEQPRGQLILLKEFQAHRPFLDIFFLPLTDDCVLYHCEQIYTDLSEVHEDDAMFYRDYARKKKVVMGSLVETPYLSNFNLGISIIRQWIDEGLLSIAKNTVIYDQLAAMVSLDLDGPTDSFFAANALRFVIGSYFKSPPSLGGNAWRPKRKQYAVKERKGLRSYGRKI